MANPKKDIKEIEIDNIVTEAFDAAMKSIHGSDFTAVTPDINYLTVLAKLASMIQSERFLAHEAMEEDAMDGGK